MYTQVEDLFLSDDAPEGFCSLFSLTSLAYITFSVKYPYPAQFCPKLWWIMYNRHVYFHYLYSCIKGIVYSKDA